MTRPHRSLIRRAKSVDANAIANSAEDYLYGYSLHKRYLTNASYLVTPERIRKHIQKIDKLEREMISLENKIDNLAERRALEAAKLEDALNNNFEIIGEFLEPAEYRDFRR